MTYKPIFFTDEYTAVCEERKDKIGKVQTEKELEDSFIKQLQLQGYQYLQITTSDEMKANLKECLEKLNRPFSTNEWEQIETVLYKRNNTLEDKTILIQKERVITITSDNGESYNVKLIDDKDIFKNKLQVINQYEANGIYKNIYDVTILVNGFPLVHCELKKRGTNKDSLREAFNQIERYKRNSFWSESGLYEFIQLFVISNGTLTKYYSNTVRKQHVKSASSSSSSDKKNGFKFTSYWTGTDNEPIQSLEGFTDTFLTRRTLLNILTKYCVFDVDHNLKVMRPYQIVATEYIINQILIAHLNPKRLGTIDAGGYIWHTTGSGKTLTSFKAAQLASQFTDAVDKVLFVVDRKDLDYQTMKEYNKFQENSVDSTKNTRELAKRLSDDESKIIVTTINKLSEFVKSHTHHDIYNKRVVMIFDECHRSQFGEMSKSIKKAFKKYYMFGFTGTPILARNASASNPEVATTEGLFGRRLHIYNIVNAISDGNVLPFNVTAHPILPKMNDDVKDRNVRGINTEDVLISPERISKVVDHIIDNFDIKTRDRKFNSIFAVGSTKAAKKYYMEFKNREHDLKIATIFTHAANEDTFDGVTEEDMDVATMGVDSRDFLESAISDYNDMFQTNFSTKNDKGFENYYKDVAQKMKDKKLDMLIVVNMFLTGFDAPTLNTLWVDKHLRMHGLIQAYSRTNRILNATKTYGNIIPFRNLEKETADALSLFGNKDASGIVLLRSYDDYLDGYTAKGRDHIGYRSMVSELMELFDPTQRIVGESNQKNFIVRFGSILSKRNILKSFEQFVEDGPKIFPEDRFNMYMDRYHSLNEEYKEIARADKESILGDIHFEEELAKETRYGIDSILDLVNNLHNKNCSQKEILEHTILKVNSDHELRSKKELIEIYIKKVANNSYGSGINSNGLEIVDVDAWNAMCEEEKVKEFEEFTVEYDEKLDIDEFKTLVDMAFSSDNLSALEERLLRCINVTRRRSSTNNALSVSDDVYKYARKFFEKYRNTKIV